MSEGAQWKRLGERWGEVEVRLRRRGRDAGIVDARGEFEVFAGSNNDVLLERAEELGARAPPALGGDRIRVSGTPAAGTRRRTSRRCGPGCVAAIR